MKRFTTEEFIAKAKKVHGNRYDYSEVVYINKYTNVKIFCNTCKRWFEQSPRQHLVCKKCPSCLLNKSIQVIQCNQLKTNYPKHKNNIKKTTEEFIKEAKLVHGDKYDYSEVVYINNHTKVKIFCKKCKKFFYQTPSNHLRSNCPYCAKNKKLTQAKFIQHAKKIHKDKYDYKSISFINTRTKVKIFCKKCKCYFEQKPNNHLMGNGCPHCAKNKKLTQAEFMQYAKKIHKNKYDYKESFFVNTYTKVKIYCNKCKKFFYQTPGSHLVNKNGCPYCKESRGELQIKDWLDSHEIEYEIQKCFKDCRDKRLLPFDFYLPEYNMCIEYQGKQHYEEGFSIYLKRYKTPDLANLAFKTQVSHDNIKQQYCEKQNITLLTIKYNTNIDTILARILTKS